MKHLRAILLLPFMVTVVIPTIIVWRFGPDTLGLWQSLPVQLALSVVGVILICVGLVLMVLTNRLFMTIGKGTLAPWNPTQHLVVVGIYRHTRNPMISGVMAILLGETLCAASLPLGCWFIFFVTMNAIFIPLAEEPGLVKRFGEDYERYRRNVPRWIPRLARGVVIAACRASSAAARSQPATSSLGSDSRSLWRVMCSTAAVLSPCLTKFAQPLLIGKLEEKRVASHARDAGG